MAKKRKLKQQRDDLWWRLQTCEAERNRYQAWLKSVERDRDHYENKWLELLKKHEPEEYDREMFRRYINKRLFEELNKKEDEALLYGTQGTDPLPVGLVTGSDPGQDHGTGVQSETSGPLGFGSDSTPEGPGETDHPDPGGQETGPETPEA